jgi:hypothetical protein
MKTQLTIIFAILTVLCFGQNQQTNNAYYVLTIPYRPAVIQILSDSGTLRPEINRGNVQQVTYLGIAPGQYRIQISGQGQSTIVRDSIIVKKGQNLVLNFTFNGPCLYDHTVGYIPTCPKNHTDGIIPIVYGLIATKGDTFIKDEKEMKVKYAGCVTTDCDPRFYCKEHEIEF